MSKPEIIVIDRRGQNHGTVEIEAPKPQESEEVQKGKRTWEDVKFVIAITQGPDGSIAAVIGRAMGLRGDGNVFIADWWFGPEYPRSFDWTKVAQQRLNTFLGCDCKTGYQCHTHQIAIQNWQKDDSLRIENIRSRPMSKVIEIWMRAEQARQKTGIVVPR